MLKNVLEIEHVPRGDPLFVASGLPWSQLQVSHSLVHWPLPDLELLMVC